MIPTVLLSTSYSINVTSQYVIRIYILLDRLAEDTVLIKYRLRMHELLSRVCVYILCTNAYYYYCYYCYYFHNTYIINHLVFEFASWLDISSMPTGVIVVPY